MSVDGVGCPNFEPTPFNKIWYSGKLNGARLRLWNWTFFYNSINWFVLLGLIFAVQWTINVYSFLIFDHVIFFLFSSLHQTVQHACAIVAYLQNVWSLENYPIFQYSPIARYLQCNKSNTLELQVRHISKDRLETRCIRILSDNKFMSLPPASLWSIQQLICTTVFL